MAAAHATALVHILVLVHATASAQKNIPANEFLGSFADVIVSAIVRAIVTVLAAAIASALADVPENIPDENNRRQKSVTALKIENPEYLDLNALSEMHSQHF